MSRSGDEFRVTLPAAIKDLGTRCYLEVHADSSQPKLNALLLAAKVSTAERVPFLAMQALPGVPTERMPGPPPELPPGQTAAFFRLKQEHDEWGKYVVQADGLTVLIRGAPPDLHLNFVTILPSG